MRSTAIMSVATLSSRITGFLRTWACAFALGNTLLTSSYQIANSVPNMLFELVAGGILSTAFLPVFLAQRDAHGKEAASSFASNIFNICLVALGIIALLATVFAPQVIATQTFMTGGEDAELATFFFRIFAIQIVFYGAGAIISGLLNANRKFLWPAFGPLFNNVVVIITMFGFVPIAAVNPDLAKIWLATGTTLGVVAMFAVQIPSLAKEGLHYVPKIDFRDPGLRETARLAVPAIIFTAINLVCVSVRNAFALGVSPSGPASLSYAWLWFQLPYGVLAVALSTAMFTEMSENAAKKNMDAFKSNARDGLRGTFFLIIPMAVMLITLSSMLVTLYHAGQFTENDIAVVSGVLRWWAICLPFYAGYMYLYFAFSSLRDLMTVTKVNLCISLVQIALYALLTLGFGNWSGLGLIGIPISDIVFFSLMFIALFFVLRKRIGSFGGKSIAGVVGKTLIGAAVGGGITYATNAALGATTSIGGAFVHIVIAGGLGLTVTYGICTLLGIEEMSILKRLGAKILRKLPRRTTD
ncbi:MAG: murein biosynthesis integral membrane protein MurJ [Actinobacteria bacterium]|nr:murein biosynthesis integral membrane protein MurJ [Actinomycetota bacterium]